MLYKYSIRIYFCNIEGSFEPVHHTIFSIFKMMPPAEYILSFSLLSCLLVRVQAVYIPPDMKDYVRYTDDGLYRGTINAFEKEWKKTFIDGVILSLSF